ncbi:hypothetical protein [Candidatus Methanoperedens nitratireducens]|nr:hypothetical protein [Candidatus Methanoperedens nitroreducens]
MKYGNTEKALSERKNAGRMKSMRIWISIALIVVAAAGCVSKPDDMTKNETLETPVIPTVSSTPTKPDLTLNNYMKLFEKDVIIVIGENATQIELDAAKAIAYNLGELTGTVPVIKTGAEVTENEKAGYNLTLVGIPKENKILQDVYKRTNATRVTDEYPGAGKGILEVLRNPWNESKMMLLVEGSDEWGVRAGSVVLEEKQKLKDKAKVLVDWEEATGVKFPIDNAEEAIKYAKMDVDVKRFIERMSTKGYKVDTKSSNTSIKWSNDWVVRFQAISSPIEEDVFTVVINQNGTIVYKGL